MSHDTRIFFIAGCQRSGTTLLRLVLESHPQIACFDEQRAYAMLPRRRSLRTRIAIAATRRRVVGFKIPRYTEQLRFDATDDPDYGRAAAFYDGEPIVFLLRSVEDVVTSMCSLILPDGGSWMQRYGVPILRHAARRPAFAERYRDALSKVEALGFAAPAVGALYWRYKNDAFFEYLEAGLPVLGVRYEALVRNPEGGLRRVVEHLGVAWDARVLEHPRIAHREIENDGLAIGGTDPRRPIDQGSIGKHRDHLSDADLDLVREIAAPTRAVVERLA